MVYWRNGQGDPKFEKRGRFLRECGDENLPSGSRSKGSVEGLWDKSPRSW